MLFEELVQESSDQRLGFATVLFLMGAEEVEKSRVVLLSFLTQDLSHVQGDHRLTLSGTSREPKRACIRISSFEILFILQDLFASTWSPVALLCSKFKGIRPAAMLGTWDAKMHA